MSFSFGEKSEGNLQTCCTELQTIMREAIKRWDFSILCGHRNAVAQNKAYDEGESQKQYPNSEHNVYPSNALDLAPYPVNWNDLGSFYLLVGYVIRVAEELGYEIRSGSDWDGDKSTTDQTFHDLGHLEYIGRLDII